MSASNKKKNSKGASSYEKYAPPDVETLHLDDNYLFKSALKNEYQPVCGAFDAKEHPLASFVIERDLFNKRNEYGKTAFDLAAYVGSRDFLKAIFDRINDKLDENVINFKSQLKPSNAYNFMHYACVWGRLDIVRMLVDQQKLIVDPALDTHHEMMSPSVATMHSTRSQVMNANFKTLGALLLRTKTKNDETPKDLAKRYNHTELVEFLEFAEKRQAFIDSVYEIKQTTTDPEKHQNKLNKDDKKKLDKIYTDTLEWLEKNRENTDMQLLETKIKETEDEVRPLIEKLIAKINENTNSTSNITNGSMSSRSKLFTPNNNK